ncbi:MAG TPA: ABC transporter substrate-binding protein [Clostridia bacterium]|nr:ABC transporter substrate-binding protein [Clostridia bacterium]
MKKRILCLVLVVAILVFTAACGKPEPASQPVDQGANGTSDYKDTIKIAVDVDPNTLDPRLQTNVSVVRVGELVFSGLVELNEKLEPQPCLAESWEQKDATTLIFHLKKDVKWHDGTAFTAADVKYTFDTILDKDFGSAARSRYVPIKEILTPDDYTVQFNMSEPYAPLLTYMDHKIVPQSAKDNPGFAENPIGTGPYKFVSWSKNSVIKLTANDSYFGGTPATKNIEVHTIPDNTTRVSALEAGDVDFIHSPLSPQDVPRMKQEDKVVVYQANGLGVTFVNFNHQSEILKDKNVRIGLAYMIDKDTISKDIYQGMDTPANGPVLPASWAYSADIKDYPYDPAKGLQVLSDAGWKDTNGDGILDKDGKKLTVRLSTHTEDPNRVQAIEYIQNTLASNGIDAQVSTYEWATLSADFTAGNYDIAIAGLLNITDPDRGMYIQFHTGGGQNYGKYSYPEMDALLDKGRTTSDQSERAKIYQQTAQMINDEVMWKTLVFQGYIVMYNKNLEGYTPMPSGQISAMRDAKVKN